MTFRPREVAAILFVGVIGVLIPGLQPQLLGALAAEGRISVNALGPLATVELLAMGAAAGGAGFVLPADRLRPIAALALLAAAMLDAASPLLATGGLFAARIGAGLAEGTLIWLVIAFIVRRTRPERWSGIYLALQTAGQFAVASLLGLRVADSGAGFATLAIVTVAGLIAVPFLPRAYAPIVAAGEASGAIPARGYLALLGALLMLAGAVAVWVYVEPLGIERGVPPGLLRVVAPLSLAMQVLGAGAASVLADRLRARVVMTGMLIADLLVLALMAAPPTPTVFAAATAAFGFLWLFAMPFQVPLVVAADPSRRAALLIGGAQLTGSSLGPLIAAQLVTARDLLPVLRFGAVTLAVGIGLLIAVGRPRLRTGRIPSGRSANRCQPDPPA